MILPPRTKRFLEREKFWIAREFFLESEALKKCSRYKHRVPIIDQPLETQDKKRCYTREELFDNIPIY